MATSNIIKSLYNQLSWCLTVKPFPLSFLEEARRTMYDVRSNVPLSPTSNLHPATCTQLARVCKELWNFRDVGVHSAKWHVTWLSKYWLFLSLPCLHASNCTMIAYFLSHAMRHKIVPFTLTGSCMRQWGLRNIIRTSLWSNSRTQCSYISIFLCLLLIWTQPTMAIKKNFQMSHWI